MKKREIKFRAWVDWGFNEMINNYCFLDSDMSFMGHDRTNNNYKVIAVMQFTGMKDSEGNDIYEGDILIGLFDQRKYEVVFDCGCFSLKIKDIMLRFSIIDFSVLKVIDNIYENTKHKITE